MDRSQCDSQKCFELPVNQIGQYKLVDGLLVACLITDVVNDGALSIIIHKHRNKVQNDLMSASFNKIPATVSLLDMVSVVNTSNTNPRRLGFVIGSPSLQGEALQFPYDNPPKLIIEVSGGNPNTDFGPKKME